MVKRTDVIQVQGINSQGYGIIPKMVMQDKRLTIQAKAIYGYFCSYAGAGKTAFPSRKKIIKDLGISVNTYYRHFNLLKDCGYIEVTQEKDQDGFFDRNIYTLVESLPCPKNEDTDANTPCLKYGDTQNPYTQNCDIIKVTDSKINSIYNYQSVSPDETDGTDAQNRFKDALAVVRDNVSYEDLETAYRDDMALIDEIISITLDTLLSDSETVRIGGIGKPRELVKSNLMKLRYDNIVHVLEQFKAQGHRIKNKPQYILAMLYNSPMELNAHYTNWVQSNMTFKEES